MNISKWIFPVLLSGTLILLTLVPIENAKAQLSLGASYEVRDEDPTNGFGVRVQHELFSFTPLVDIGLRGHFSFFNDEIDVSENNVSYSSDIETYDFGVALLTGLNLGLVKPYVGAGLGSENYEEVRTGIEEGSFSDNSLYWNIFAGAEVLPIPIVKPFIEYRFTRLFDDNEFNYNQNGRLAVGVLVRF